MLKYLWYVIRHKWFVFVAGLRLRVPIWQLIVHDMSKFRPDEFFPYANYFYRPVPSAADFYGDIRNHISHWREQQQEQFDIAWLKHQHRNPHHWQYWLLRNDNPGKNWYVQANQPEVGPWQLYSKAHGKQVGEMFPDKDDPFNCQSEKIALDICKAMDSQPVPIEMPYKFVKEMVADWIGAGQAMGKNDVIGWYQANKDKMTLHPRTRYQVENLLGISAQ